MENKPKFQTINGTSYNVDAVLRMKKEDFLKAHKHAFDAEKAYDQIHAEAKKPNVGNSDKVS